MNFDWTEPQRAMQQEIRDFLHATVPDELRDSLHEGEPFGEEEVWDQTILDFHAGMVSRGWQVPDLPIEDGGRAHSPLARLILISELDYANAPRFLRPAAVSIVPALVKFGTDENKRMWLGGLVSGEIDVSIGYSEPDAGSDLAKLRTRARREGDHWVINGQKTWNTRGQAANYIWLLARTGNPDDRHKGLSVIMVPLNASGVEVRPIRNWGDHYFSDVFFSEVRVPLNHIIGAEGQGWAIMAHALNGERSFFGLAGPLKRLMELLTAYCKTTCRDGVILASRPEVRFGLARLEAEIELAYLMGIDIASRLENGASPEPLDLGLKIFTSDVRVKLASFANEVLGMSALLDYHDPEAPMGGMVETLYRRAPIGRLGVGANEILRDGIAQRGLGLPRLTIG